MKNSIKRSLTRGESTASQVYFSVLTVQLWIALGLLPIAILFMLGVRFSIRGGGFYGVMFTAVLTLIFYDIVCIIGFWAVGYIMSLGDDSYKRRDRIGRYEAQSIYVEKMMKHVETAIEHRGANGRLVGYMVGGRYIPLQKIQEILIDYSGGGGFSISGNGFNEVQK